MPQYTATLLRCRVENAPRTCKIEGNPAVVRLRGSRLGVKDGALWGTSRFLSRFFSLFWTCCWLNFASSSIRSDEIASPSALESGPSLGLGRTNTVDCHIWLTVGEEEEEESESSSSLSSGEERESRSSPSSVLVAEGDTNSRFLMLWVGEEGASLVLTRGCENKVGWYI